MNKTFISALFVVTALFFANAESALAGNQKINLNSTPIIMEMGASSGKARVNLDKGTVKVSVKNMPEDAVTVPLSKFSQGFHPWRAVRSMGRAASSTHNELASIPVLKELYATFHTRAARFIELSGRSDTSAQNDSPGLRLKRGLNAKQSG